jgi:nucleotide-binding universal stress UspA family protein
MFSHILIAWDASPEAHRAFEYGQEIAARFSSRIDLVSIAQAPEHVRSDAERERNVAEARAYYEEQAAGLVQAARERGIDLHFRVVPGAHPAEGILKVAHQGGVDLIIMGRRGKSLAQRFMIGSVSDRVSRYAACPVLIVGKD